ncbi:MAG TPA: YDG domain-containing protein [Caulobacteraceae bacterium]
MIFHRRHQPLSGRAALLGFASVMAVAASCGAAVAAPVLPTGGKVQAGLAAIGPVAGANLTISQSSNKAIIDWVSFSIGSGASVRFNNGAGVTLNRVTGGAEARIDGGLSATGSVFLLDPDGVIVGKNGIVSVGGGFVASSLNLSNSQFMSGGALTFSGSSAAPVTNAGQITAAGGDVLLIGADVENDGVIQAPDGTAGLAAGHKVAVAEASGDDGKISVLIGGPDTSVTNAGLIAAANAELRANGGNVYALAVGSGSRIVASGMSMADGRVFLVAGGGGSVTARGEIDATRADGSGGAVETSGAAVDFTGVTVRAGNWLIDPVTLTVDAPAATTIATNLATTSVILQTTATTASGPGNQSPGVGDIIVDAPISWASANTLTLDAYHSIAINADVTASGAGKLDLVTNDGGTGGRYGFGPGASVQFTGAPGGGQALSINGQAYSLVYSQTDLTNINNNLSGFYALAKPLDLTGTIFTAAPIANVSDAAAGFTGTFTGLGNTISNLTIYDATPVPQTTTLSTFPNSNGEVGLFGIVGAGGVTENINLANAQVTGGDGMQVGALIGLGSGTVVNASSSGAVTTGSGAGNANGFAQAIAGGLVGSLAGTIEDSHSSATVTGADAIIGGLVGVTEGGAITGSFATGAVNVGSPPANLQENAWAGGLAGRIESGAVVTSSYATGNVSGGAGSLIGGFVGLVDSAQVGTSYATGSVTQAAAGQNADNLAGGFAAYVGVGVGVVTQSWSSGAVNTVGGSATAGSYTNAGGFVGVMSGIDSVSNAYALGPVTVTGSNLANIGGFAGTVNQGASADHVYATGLVSGSGSVGTASVGGLVGAVGYGSSGAISDSYWDEGTTGQTVGYNIYGGGTATNVTGIGGSTGISPYAAATYANFDMAGVWALLEGLTRPVLRSEYSTTITNAHQLELMNANLSATYTLAGDIDASETSNPSGIWNPANGFVPVGGNGNGASGFTGVFDGAGYTISNLTVIGATPTSQATPLGYQTDREVGLFGLIGVGGAVQNVSLANVDAVGGDGTQVGALAGVSVGTVTNVTTSGVVTTGSGDDANSAPAAAGGLIGGLGGAVIDSHSSATVTGAAARVGGLIGETVGGAITRSSASGAVTDGDASATVTEGVSGGGLVGYLLGGTNPATIDTSYATGAVTGGAGSHIGGFAGLVQSSQVTTSYATGSVTQTAAGVNAHDYAGGFAAFIGGGAIVTQSWSGGAVTTVGASGGAPVTVAGGFVADVLGGTVSQSYSLGSVSSSGGNLAYLGGFAGLVESGAGVDHVYATGLVSGPGTTAGLVALLGYSGDSDTSGSLTESYWDEGTTGQTTGYTLSGTGSATNVTGIGGSTGLSPYATATYANFDLTNSWGMIEGETRPVLLSEYSTTITNAHQLELIGLNLSAQYTLANDIDASETTNPSGVWNPANGFVPIGGFSMNGPFTGVLDGHGHTISNLTIIDAPQQASQTVGGFDTFGVVGLFGVVGAGGLVLNVNLANAQVTGGDGEWVGALAGGNLGEILGDSAGGVVSAGSSLNNAMSGGSAIAGGLVGASTGLISSSQASVNVAAGNDAFVGGLVGAVATGGSVTGSHATGSVVVGARTASSGDNTHTLAGGLVGYLYGYHQGDVNPVATPITGSYATGPVAGGAGSFIGGFVGQAIQGQISDSYATGAVTQTAGSANGDNDIAGGFAGVIDAGASVSQSFASGAVTVIGGMNTQGDTLAGGFVGGMRLGATVSDAYATGAVTSTGSAFAALGGFAGLVQQSASVDHTYATGAVTGSGSVGGLVGQVGDTDQTDTSGSISNSYWDEGTTGQTVGYTLVGTGTATAVTGIGGATGISPFAQATYAGWDFNTIWSPPSAGFYPELYGVSHVLRITVGDSTATYGAFPTYMFSDYGLQFGDGPQVVSGVSVTAAAAAEASSGFVNAGSYGLDATGAMASDPSGAYRLIYVAGALDIAARSLTASLTGSVEKTYDGTTAATLASGNYQLSGAIAGDNVALNDPASGTYDSKDAGTGKTVSVGGLMLTGADAGDYTVNLTASAPIGIIDPAALVALVGSLTGTVEKTYDGTTTANLTAANYLLSGAIVAGDSVALNDPTIGTYDTRNVGAGKTVTVTGLALIGAQASDYTVNGSASAAIGIIDAKALMASLVGNVEKTYDGTTTATLAPANYQLAGVVAGDSVSLNDPTAGTYDSKNAGTGKTVSVGGLALSGTDAGNYTVDAAASDPVGDITAIMLSASLTGSVQKNFDGTTLAILTPANYVLSSGVLAGDSIALNDPASGTYDTAASGTGKTVSVSGIALTGADAGGYQVNSDASAPIGSISAVTSVPPIQTQIVTVSVIAELTAVAATPDDATAAAAAGAPTSVVGIFPVIGAPPSGFIAGDRTPVTGAGNGDLWAGAGIDEACPPDRDTECKP